MTRIPPPTLAEYIADQRAFASMVGAVLVQVEVPEIVAAAARRDGGGLFGIWALDIDEIVNAEAGHWEGVEVDTGPGFRALFRYPDGRETWGGYVVSEDGP